MGTKKIAKVFNLESKTECAILGPRDGFPIRGVGMAKDHAIVVSEDPEILIKVWKLNKDDEIKFIRPIDGMWLETSKGFIVT